MIKKNIFNYVIDVDSRVSDSEIFAGESLTELPMGRSDVPRGGGAAVAARHAKRQRLPHQNRV